MQVTAPVVVVLSHVGKSRLLRNATRVCITCRRRCLLQASSQRVYNDWGKRNHDQQDNDQREVGLHGWDVPKKVSSKQEAWRAKSQRIRNYRIDIEEDM